MPLWRVEYSEHAKKQLRKMDNSVKIVIERFVKRLPEYPNPRSIGKALKGQFAGLWRYSLTITGSFAQSVMMFSLLKLSK